MVLGLILQKNEQRSITTVKRFIRIRRARYAETVIVIITNHVRFVWVKGILTIELKSNKLKQISANECLMLKEI